VPDSAGAIKAPYASSKTGDAKMLQWALRLRPHNLLAAVST